MKGEEGNSLPETLPEEESPPETLQTLPSKKLLLWPYFALLTAVFAMSSGGLWFSILPESPPLMKAFWRLFFTSLLQGVGFYRSVRIDPSLTPEFWEKVWGSAGRLVYIGLSLGMHFGAWGWSVDHTSLAHSLLLVWTTPLLMVLLAYARYLLDPWIVRPPEEGGAVEAASRSPFLPPTLLEISGTAAGFLGVAVLMVSVSAGSGQERGVTLAGDAAALLGAAAIIPYLEGGSQLRKWMPLFVYALPVTLGAALWLGAASLALESEALNASAAAASTPWGFGPGALLGFLGSPKRFGVTLGAAAVSGILGHTLVNLALGHLSPLLISVSCLWEPLLGSILGWAVGVQGVPGTATAIAAPLLLLGGVLVSLGERKKAAQGPQNN